MLGIDPKYNKTKGYHCYTTVLQNLCLLETGFYDSFAEESRKTNEYRIH